MSSGPITISIPINVKGINAMFWMSSATVEESKNGHKVNLPSVNIYLQIQKPYEETVGMTFEERKTLSYTISQYNHDRVKQVFIDALSWFNEESKNQLFGLTPTDVLVVNSEFQNLQVSHVDEFSAIKTVIKIVPATIEVAVGKYEPGVVVYFNKLANNVLLTESEFKRLADFVITLSMQSYSLFAISCLLYAQATNTIISLKEIQSKYNNERKYNTNLK